MYGATTVSYTHLDVYKRQGVRNAEEAVFAAQLAREAFGTNWLKLEIHPDPRYLLPDSIETLKATDVYKRQMHRIASLSKAYTVTIFKPDISGF